MALQTEESPRKLELVSLIDVVFLLLIFFIVTTSVLPKQLGEEKVEARETIMLPDFDNTIRTPIDAYIYIPENLQTIYLIESSNLVALLQGNLTATRLNFSNFKNSMNNIRSGTVVISPGPSLPLRDVMRIVNICEQFSNKVIFSKPDINGFVQFIGKAIQKGTAIEKDEVK